MSTIHNPYAIQEYDLNVSQLDAKHHKEVQKQRTRHVEKMDEPPKNSKIA